MNESDGTFLAGLCDLFFQWKNNDGQEHFRNVAIGLGFSNDEINGAIAAHNAIDHYKEKVVDDWNRKWVEMETPEEFKRKSRG